MNRRKLLEFFVKGAGLVMAGVLGVPAVLMAISPAFRRRDEDERWRPLGQLDNFPVGTVTEGRYDMPRRDWARGLRQKGVYVWRATEEADAVVVYSRNCTDLSCPVNWDRGSQCFFCPCHGGIFDLDGTPMAGPPPRPLYRYATRIRDGVLEIDTDSLPPMT